MCLTAVAALSWFYLYQQFYKDYNLKQEQVSFIRVKLKGILFQGRNHKLKKSMLYHNVLKIEFWMYWGWYFWWWFFWGWFFWWWYFLGVLFLVVIFFVRLYFWGLCSWSWYFCGDIFGRYVLGGDIFVVIFLVVMFLVVIFMVVMFL